MNPSKQDPRGVRRVAATAPAAGVFLVLLVAAAWPLTDLLSCAGTCVPDAGALAGGSPLWRELHAADIRLNAWILAWVQHALLESPSRLYDANAFWPAPRALVGSEHMLGLALQTLPLRWFSSNAVTLYAAATVLSFLVAAVCSYAVVWTVSGNRTASLLAGVAAAWMPWRFSELAHIQLMSAGWFPLVWLLAMQLWFEDDRRPWRPVALLTVVASLQMLTSYYLSYFLLLSVAACLVVWLPARRPPVRSFVRLVAPLTLAAGVTAILALPYLEASSTGVVRLRGHAASSATLGQAWQSLKPIVRFTTDDAGGWNGAYRIPIVLLLLGLVTLIPIGRPHRALPRAAAGTRLREGPLIAGLWMVSLVGFALSLGRELRVGGLTLPLPAALLAAVVPGFANMRVPLRWQILIGVAVPILAGIGFARLRRWLSVRLAAGGPSGRPPRWAGPAAAALAVAAGATLLPPPIPTAPAMPRVAGAAQAYRELARMPDGPVVEIPWPLQPNVDGWYSSEYELASAIHWKPILNGYTAYTPRTYDFLRRMAAGLPRGDSLDRLVRLAALRWIVVHLDLLSPAERDAWHMAPTQGRLVSAYTDEHTAIFEIPPSPESGVWMPALLATAPRRQTFAGLPRTRIELSAGSGRLQATIPSRMELTDGDWLKTAVMVRVTNRSKQPWPGLDIDPEGLVAVHYRIERPDGTVATEGVSPIDADIAPGTTLDLWAAIEGRLDPGHYRLRLGLVQRFGSSVQPLAIEQVVGEVQLEPAR